MSHHRRAVIAAAGGALLVPAWSASAQVDAARPPQLLVPFAPGGTTDVVARILAEGLAKELNQNVLVDNKGGAGGTIGARELARAPADGQTIGLMSVSTHGTNPAVYKSLPYDVERDFTPISKLLAFPGVLAVHPRFPAKDFAAFLRVVRMSPGKYSYASSGAGAATHMCMELLKATAGLFNAHIPYRGSGPAINDVVAGQVDMIWDALPSALPFLRSGQLVPIALAAGQRGDRLPHVPTFTESGLKDYAPELWNGLLGPAGMSGDRVSALHELLRRCVHRSDIRTRLEDLGATVSLSSPQELARLIQRDVAVWRRVAKFAGVLLDDAATR